MATPDDLVITVRNMRFEPQSAKSRWWANGEPIASRFVNAAFLSFPIGEAYVVGVEKSFRDGLPPNCF